jgi:hypothetical protein
MWRLLAALCVATGLFTFGGAASGSSLAFADVGNGNSANAHLCQQGGYSQVQTNTGRASANPGQCVSYAAQGGTLYQPTVIVTTEVNPVPFTGNLLFCAPNSPPGTVWCMIAQGTGFHPDTLLTVTYTIGPYGPFTASGTTSASGDAGLKLVSDCAYHQMGEAVTFSFTDSYGVHASASATIPC